MPAIFGSGSTVDAAGAIVPPSAVELVPTPPAAPAENGSVPAPVENGSVPAPVEGAEVPPAGGTVPELPPTEEVPPVEPTETPPEDDDELLPPPGQSRRRFVRDLFRRVTAAEQRVPQLEQQNAALTALIHDLRQGPPAQQPQAPVPPPAQQSPAGAGLVPPRPDAFATHEEYVTALTSFSASQAVQQALAERDQQMQAQRQAWEQQQRQQYAQAKQQAWQAKMVEGRQQYEDFDMALGNPAASLAPAIQPLVVESVLESPHGSAMLHYLGTHPDVTHTLNQMTPYAAVRLLGEIEAVVRPRPVETPPTSPPRVPPTAPVVPPTPLPAPLQPVGGSQAPVSPTQFRQGMSLEAYTRMREAELQRRRA